MKFTLALIFVIAVTTATIAQISPPQSTGKPKDETTFPPMPPAIMQAELTDINGGKFRLDDLRGKVILVNLWAVWCIPCGQQMRELVELQKKYDRRDFEIIGLNVGDDAGDPEDIRRMKLHGDRIKVNYPLVQSSSLVSKGFYSLASFDSVPISLLIDRDGRLRVVFRGSGPLMPPMIQSSVEKVVKPK